MAAPTLKLCFLGHSNVGKSAILLRFTDNKFLAPQDASSTIGVDFKVKMIQRGDRKFKLTLWDTAGQERFRTLTSAYYRDAHGIILVYDITNRDTFDQLEREFVELQNHVESNVVKLVVGNKTDRVDERAVTFDQGEQLANLRGALFCECSAKDNQGISEALDAIVGGIVAKPELWERTNLSPRDSTIGRRLSRPLSVYSGSHRASRRLSASLPISAVFDGTQDEAVAAATNGSRSAGASPPMSPPSPANSSWAQQHFERQRQLEAERQRGDAGCAC